MISLCLTTYNRIHLLYDSFNQVIKDDRISEIIIVDDCSRADIYQTIAWYCKDIDKIKLYRNNKNLDCYRNKREAVSKASNEWVILFDSDNILTRDYVDRIFDSKSAWSKNQIIQPEAAKPHFNFNKYAGRVFSKENVASFIHDPTFQTMLNAMNYFVHRDEYLRVWDDSIDPVTSDSIYQNYRWLESGNTIFVAKGLEYQHRVNNHGKEEISHYAKNNRRTPRNLYNDIINKIKKLK